MGIRWISAMAADRDHLIGLGEVDPLDRHRHPEHFGLERQSEMVRHHGEQPAALLRLVVRIDDRLLDEPLEASPSGRPAARTPGGRGSGHGSHGASKSPRDFSSYSTVGSSRSCADARGASSVP